MQRIVTTFLRAFTIADKIFEKFIEILLAAVLMGMIALVFIQVILRDVFNSGISWADVASRHMVLWIAFLGAMMATRSRQHLSIDLLSRLLPRRGRNVLRFFLDLAACIVCYVMMAAAITLVIAEHDMGTMLFLDVPLWIVQLVIPIGFGLIAGEYAIGVILDILRFFYNGKISTLAAGRRPV